MKGEHHMRAPANREADHESSDNPSSNQEARVEKRNPSHLKRKRETRGRLTGVFVAIAERSVVVVERSAVLVLTRPRSWVRVPPWWFGSV